MAKISFDKTTISEIEARLSRNGVTPRTYLGMSQLGDACERALTYYFRHCYTDEIPARLQRIFDTGHRAEEFIINDLKAIGVDIYGEQDEYVEVHGHLRGHNDAIGKGFPEAPDETHLIEFKTSNDANFKQLQKKGVKEVKPTHYAQMMLYAHLAGLKWALYMVINKNTSEYYVERVIVDDEFAKELLRKAERIILEETLPRKINENASFYLCKFCNARDICHKGGAIHKSCRNCEYGTIVDDGKWECGLHDKQLGDFTPCCEYKLDEWLKG